MKTPRTAELTEAEKAAADLARARRKRDAIKVNRDWMKSCGMLMDTPEEREAWALGEAWRRAQTDPQ